MPREKRLVSSRIKSHRSLHECIHISVCSDHTFVSTHWKMLIRYWHILRNRLVGKPNFSDQFKKIVKRYIRVGYNLDIMRQSACLVLNPITVYSYGFLFNCTTVGQASDSMTALT